MNTVICGRWEYLKWQGSIFHHQSRCRCQREQVSREVFGEAGYPPVSSANKTCGGDGSQQRWTASHLCNVNLAKN